MDTPADRRRVAASVLRAGALAGPMKTLAILPVKTLRRRQAAPVAGAAGARAPLARRGDGADVLAALARVRGAGRDRGGHRRRVRARGRRGGRRAQVLDDTARGGQSPAALIGVEHALAAGFDAGRCSCPATRRCSTRPRSRRCWTRRRPLPGVTIVPDRHGTGTNALLLDPPDAIAPSFGPGSFERHRQAAEAAGAELLVEPAAVAGARRGHRRRPRPAGWRRWTAGRARAPATRARARRRTRVSA